jgi:hypothetical protein
MCPNDEGDDEALKAFSSLPTISFPSSALFPMPAILEYE